MTVFLFDKREKFLLVVDAMFLCGSKETAVEFNFLTRVSFIIDRLLVQSRIERSRFLLGCVKIRIIPVWRCVHLDVGNIRQATVNSKTKEFSTDRVRCFLKGH